MIEENRQAGGEHEGQLPHHELRTRRADDKRRSRRKEAVDLPGQKNDPSGGLLVRERPAFPGGSFPPFEKGVAGMGRGDPEEAMEDGEVGHVESARKRVRPERRAGETDPRRDLGELRGRAHQPERPGRVMLSPMFGIVERVHPIPGSTFRNPSIARPSPCTRIARAGTDIERHQFSRSV